MLVGNQTIQHYGGRKMVETYYVTLNGFAGLNVRTNPSTNADVTRVLKNGDRVNIRNRFENENEEWGLINTNKKNVPKEYVMMKYLTKHTDTTEYTLNPA